MVRRLPGGEFRRIRSSLSDALDDAFCALTIDAIGGGFKLKTLDYIFNGVPVAALKGTLHGLPKTVTDHFLVATPFRPWSKESSRFGK